MDGLNHLHPEAKAAIEDLGSAFKAFRERHETALETERKEREHLESRLNRMGVGGGTKPDDSAAEHKALAAFVRTGNEAELKNMVIGSDPDGGFTVVPAMSTAILNALRETSPIGGLARRVEMGPGDAWEEPQEDGEAGVKWAGETESRDPLTSPTLRLIRIPLDEITTTIRVTQRLLDDSRFDLGMWLEGHIADRFARAEGAAFVTGNGVGKPRGILTHSTAADPDSTRAARTLEYVATGTSGGFDATNPVDALVDVVNALRAPYRPRARWLMSRTTAGAVRKLKDGDGRFLWSDSLAEGQPPLLLGFPVSVDEEMPEIAANSLSIALGDFTRGYTIVDRPGLRMLRDPFSAKPNIDFYATRRVGGDVSDFDAIKLLKFGTS